MADPHPELRASDADRERVVETLRHAASDGQLTVDELSDRVTNLSMISIMGGGEIRVPHGVDVQVSNFAFMGGNEVELGNELAPAGGPTIHIRLISIMGGGGVRRGRKMSRREQRELRKAEGRELDR